jgi:MYXO-CTERM domain-containing protein
MREDNVKHSTSSKHLGRGISALALILATMSASQALAAPLAFPGAEGFGSMVTGGRKGQVYHVTTLADSGTGSLRDAVSQGNRIVVFDISGVIKPTDVIVVAGDNITLAGQSAPGDGITIYGRETSFSSRSNIIVRYLRFRQGMTDASGSAKKTVNITYGQNMIFDHVSIQWGRWDNFGITGTSSTITLQNSIVGEGVPPQNFGSIIDGEQDITIAHNLWIDNNERNPKFKANGECINNVVYNWGTGGGIIGGHSGTPWYEDYVGNYLIAGPSAVDKFFTFYTDTDHAYQTGNMVDVNKDGQLNGRAVVNADFQGTSPPTFETAAHSKPPVPVTVLSAEDAYARVVAQAGTCQHRDAVELRLIAQLTSLGTKGAIIANESDVGGQPAVTSVTRPAGFDTDNDGMSDAWETAHGLNPSSASDATGDYNGDGYTNIEKYLNELADNACAGSTPTNPDAGTVQLNDAAVPVADATVPPGKDAATTPGPDASVPTSDTATVRTDAFIAAGDTATSRPDAGSPTSDGPAVLADTAGPGGDATAARPDAAVSSPDVAPPLADAASPSTSDAAPGKTDSNVVATADAAPVTPAVPDAAATNPKPTTSASSGCSCAMGSAHSSDHLGLFSLLVGGLLWARRRSARRRRGAGSTPPARTGTSGSR